MMFNSIHSFLSTLLFVSAILLGTALGAPHVPRANAHAVRASLAGAAQNATAKFSTGALSKRGFDNSRCTFYDAGENACGSWDSDSSYVMALSPEFFGNSEHCYQKVSIWYDGKQVDATVTDECPGCSGSEVDLSRPLFEALAPLDVGVFYADWWYS
ncbi:RlpA-like double-psi beta-barrel-protein domain-containing protein-containing protein [Trametes elegans]|nr:RlpA-like double-psi beta-barrel-protein domain-containing protein-containing protein [Trametes elegans]